MSLFSLKNKVAIITGSTKGIGKAIACRMAEQGAKVVVSSRNQDACEEVAAEIREQGGEALAIACNINHQEQLQNLVEQTKQQLGSVDILVCNAALNPYFGSSQDIPDAAFDKVMHANIGSVHRLCQLVLPDIGQSRRWRSDYCLLHRWAEGYFKTRCLCDLQGSRYADSQESGCGVGPL